MVGNAIEALYIFDSNNDLILQHVYRSRPAPASVVLQRYLEYPTPRPAVIHLPEINPSTVLFSLTYSKLLFLSPSSKDVEPLFVLEFLHRLIDILEEFVGAPLLAGRIQGSYDVIAQILGEICDAGSVFNTEPNALRDDVDAPGWMGKLLGGVGLPGSSTPALSSGGIKAQLSLNSIPNGPAIPWRRANVRHTSNELYVDIVETLAVKIAPSGRPLAAFANGSIIFTSKISGIPDLLLTLSAAGGKLGLEKSIELPVFHPCVRLARWKEKPGELSFVPPDGKFVLAGYEVNLLPTYPDLKAWANASIQLPVSIEVSKSIGPCGADFEVRLTFSNMFSGSSSSSFPSRPNNNARNSGRSTPVFGGNSSTPVLQDITVTVPVSGAVKTIADIRASRGEAYFTASESTVEWRVPTKDVPAVGTATLRCTVVGAAPDGDRTGSPNGVRLDATAGTHDKAETAYQGSVFSSKDLPKNEWDESQDLQRVQQNASLMPLSASVSFSVKGWLASGIRVDGLVVDVRKSRGLGEGVKPYKGVKYLTISRNGVETRC